MSGYLLLSLVISASIFLKYRSYEINKCSWSGWHVNDAFFAIYFLGPFLVVVSSKMKFSDKAILNAQLSIWLVTSSVVFQTMSECPLRHYWCLAVPPIFTYLSCEMFRMCKSLSLSTFIPLMPNIFAFIWQTFDS